MPRIDYRELEGRGLGNPYTLLLYAFRRGKIEECLEIMAGIHCYIFRKKPSTYLRRLWKEQLSVPKDVVDRDLTLKIFHNRVHTSRHYFVRITRDECFPEYSNEYNTISWDAAPHPRIVRRGLQLMGLFGS